MEGGLLDTILKGTISARFGLIQFRGFRGEDLNVKVYDVRRTDAKWWQKFTWPLARWAKKGNNSKMGDGISFKIAGYVDLDMLHMFAV